MSTAVKILNTEETIAEINKDGEIQTITYDELLRLAPQINREDVEGVRMQIDGDNAFGCLVIADGQGSVIFGWDTLQKRIVHLTSGAYTEAMLLEGGYVYSLCNISCWGVKAHLELYRHRFGTMDIGDEGEKLDFELMPEYSSKYSNDDFWIRKENHRVIGGYKEFSKEITL